MSTGPVLAEQDVNRVLFYWLLSAVQVVVLDVRPRRFSRLPMTNIRACWASRRLALIGATTRVINKHFVAVHESGCGPPRHSQ